MKKYFIVATGLALTLTLVFIACTKKKDNKAITPTYKEEANGTGGNPTKNEVTVTGTATNITNPASSNSSIQTGGSGWSNPSCITTSSLSIKGVNGSTDVTVNFAAPPTAGTYQVGANVGVGYCTVVVSNAPNQPGGIVWYGKTGSVSVTTPSTGGIGATLNNVSCVQQTFNFPQVTVNGGIGCN